MTPSEIKSLCQNGSAQYLNYLTLNNKGRSIINIHSINPLPKATNVFKLELANKIFEPEALVFQYTPTRKEYDTSFFKIREYDYDRNLLFLKVEQPTDIDLRTINPKDFIIISDMKFLVERVQNYFRLNGEKLTLPKKASNPSIAISDFDFLPNAIPDENQQAALLAIFKNPLAYIWGAPGTGKTKFVLAYSLLYYIKQKKRVAIFAPTNVALEQVLRGVLSILDASGISRDKLLRIGTPSRTFATEFPEVCEVRGVEKKLEEINKQIAVLESILGVDDTSRDFETYETLTGLINEIGPITVKRSWLEGEINLKEKAIREGSKQLILQGKRIEQVKTSLHTQESKVSGLLHSIIKIFSSGKTALEKRIESLHAEYLREEERNLDLFEQHTALLNEKEKLVTAEINVTSELTSLLDQVKSLPFKLSVVADIVTGMDLTNMGASVKLIPAILQQQQESEDISNELKRDYAHYPPGTLEIKLKELRHQKTLLDKVDTTERLKTVNVIAATFDGFIGRFQEPEIQFDHVFVDEAGYANIVKALGVFIFDKPVTLLGDHMQLPPVNELNDQNAGADMEDTIVWRQSAIYSCNVFNVSKAELIQHFDNNVQTISEVVRRENLKKTHRFGSGLAAVLNQFVYNNGFHSGKQEGETSIRFIRATRGRAQGRGNLSEVSAIQRYLASHPNGKFSSADSLALLAPYNDQIIALGREFPELKRDLRILTVHKSQGREWDTVMLSVCDTDRMWFTDSRNAKSKGLNLINTAVSRAKTELILVCDYDFWIRQNGQLLQGLLREAEEILV